LARAETTTPAPLPRLLVLELWGLGDLALAMPFLRAAAQHARVALLAKPHAAPLLARFAPEIELLPLVAPWTAFFGKYRLHRWPWRELTRIRRELRARHFDTAVSARLDPRDHALLLASGARRRVGFSRLGSRVLLTDALPRPSRPHRAEHWRAIAAALGWNASAFALSATAASPRVSRRIVIHTGAAQAPRRWPAERFAQIATRLRAAGWDVVQLDDTLTDLDTLLSTLATAECFIGNDSGPGHLAALLGVPTFTIFGPSLPEQFSTLHPRAAWIEGAPCRYRPCFDTCRFAEPHCIRAVTVDDVWLHLQAWLEPSPTAR
jgi:heptosyltransferase-2